MVQYTEAFLASARHGYENTDQPMRELARELGIGITTLSTLAEKHGWAKRSQRKRGLPPAMQLLAEAQALANASAHSRAGGNPEEELGSRFRGDERGEVSQESEALPTAFLDETAAEGRLCPSPPVAALLGGGEIAPSARNDLLIKLEQILAQLIAAQELAPANGIHSPQGARTLTLLIQAMRALKGMRGSAPAEPGHIDDDDDEIPRDLDEFRHALARRIEALFASETDLAHAGENSGRANIGAAE